MDREQLEEAGRVLAELVEAVEHGDLDASPVVLAGMDGARSVLVEIGTVR